MKRTILSTALNWGPTTISPSLSARANLSPAPRPCCAGPGKPLTPAIRQVGALTLVPNRREMRLGQGEPILLTPLENRLLDYLMLNAGHVLTAEAIIEHVWGAEGGDRDMLRQLVHRLRSKITLPSPPPAADQSGSSPGKSGPVQPPRIETIPGLGYGLVVDSSR